MEFIPNRIGENGMKLELSIIVPIFNTRKYLKKCIDSILAQKYRNFELILIDNGSTDGCSVLCDRYGQQDKRVHVIHIEHGGVTRARKTGLDYAQGKYVSYIDSDDWLDPEFYCFFNEYPEIDVDVVLLTGYYEEWKKSREVFTGLEEGYYDHCGVQEVLTKGVIPCVWLKIFKREILIKNMSLIDPYVWMGEDMLLSSACLLDADSILIEKNCHYHYVQRQTSAAHYYHSHYGDKNIKNLYYFSKNAKKIQLQKKAYFFDEKWNQQIMDILMDVIEHEFKTQSFFISKSELNKIKIKLKSLNIPSLLVGSKDKNGIGKWKKKEKVIFALYYRRCYRFLILYLKILKMAERIGICRSI